MLFFSHADNDHLLDSATRGKQWAKQTRAKVHRATEVGFVYKTMTKRRQVNTFVIAVLVSKDKIVHWTSTNALRIHAKPAIRSRVRRHSKILTFAHAGRATQVSTVLPTSTNACHTPADMVNALKAQKQILMKANVNEVGKAKTVSNKSMNATRLRVTIRATVWMALVRTAAFVQPGTVALTVQSTLTNVNRVHACTTGAVLMQWQNSCAAAALGGQVISVTYNSMSVTVRHALNMLFIVTTA
eukprot:SAG31_NODE_2888_length_4948_cov_2.055475_3_plen_243_part_00